MPGSGSDRSGLPEVASSGPIAVRTDLNSSFAVGPVVGDFSQASHSAPPPQVPDHQLLRKIGGGSYGEVWLARNTLGTLRAVKIVYRHVFEDNRPFEREFRGIQRFEPISRTHEGLVDILQVGSAQDYFYYVMELADPIENPNPESRDPKEIRNPQSEFLNPQSPISCVRQACCSGRRRHTLVWSWDPDAGVFRAARNRNRFVTHL